MVILPTLLAIDLSLKVVSRCDNRLGSNSEWSSSWAQRDHVSAYLGENPALPPFLEPHRAAIEAGLKPLT